jgi:hypothetical protein
MSSQIGNSKPNGVILINTTMSKHKNPSATINVGIIPGIITFTLLSLVGTTAVFPHCPPKPQYI